MIRRWRARYRCHGSILCCQYIDSPMCNHWDDPHRVARIIHRRNARKDQQ